MIRIVLAEDQSMLRGALATLLALEPDMQVVAEADNGTDALSLVESHLPDVLVTDIEMPGLTGIQLSESIQEKNLETRVLIVTTFARAGYLQRAIKAGVKGYMLKDAPSHELADAIRSVARGETVVSHDLNDAMWVGHDPLSDRDRKILRLAEKGLSNKEIARELNLSPGTVRNYLNEATEKLGVSNRIEAFRMARENGWL